MRCQVVENVSTAYAKRRRWWLENKGPMPPDSTVDASCGNACCFAPAHAFLRPKIVSQVWKQLFGHACPYLLDLEPGGNIGIALAEGQDAQETAGKLRAFLHSDKRFNRSRWSVRVRDDGMLVVNKIGQWLHAGRRCDYVLLCDPLSPARVIQPDGLFC